MTTIGTQAGCSLYSLVRFGGLAIFFLGIAIMYTEPRAARRLAASRRDRRDHGRHRRARLRRGCSRSSGTSRIARRDEAVLEGRRVEPEGDGWGIRLDGRPVQNAGARSRWSFRPRRWRRRLPESGVKVAETIDPRAMPLTGLANAAIDRVAPDRRLRGRPVALRRGRPRLLSRRRTQALVDRQAEEMGQAARLGAATLRCGFRDDSGLMHVAQPEATVERLNHAVESLDSFQLAGLSPLVTTGGSLVAALAVQEKAIRAGQAWKAVRSTIDGRSSNGAWMLKPRRRWPIGNAISWPARGSSNCSVRARDQFPNEA